jgi:hypothetical protein
LNLPIKRCLIFTELQRLEGKKGFLEQKDAIGVIIKKYKHLGKTIAVNFNILNLPL